MQTLWAHVQNYSMQMGREIDLYEVQKLFGIQDLGPQMITNQSNQYLFLAKLYTSEYEYGL